MIIFESIEIENYRNIKYAKLEGLKDLNILIGPNNCGKTNILELIFSLTKLNCGPFYSYLCEQCENLRKSTEGKGIGLPLDREDFYLKDPKKAKIKLTITFNKEQIDELVPGVLEKQYKRLSEATTFCQHIKDKIVIESSNSYLLGKHFSPFFHEDIIDEIRTSIIYCPERRLQSYKGENLRKYIKDKEFTGAEFRRLIKYIREIVDPKIHDHKYEDLVRRVNGEELVASIEEQGSGVRSLICLIADVLSAKDAKVLLIDEPELGLNPFAKQEFLKILLEFAENKQIFIATQDSTFVNPILWESSKVSVYFYSLNDEKFIRVDLKQNREDPSVFAGYLPHTTSLKNIHIYVEGSSDVYIFQILLEKFLKEAFKENWFEIKNKIGIFHLCGDFWKHLLYTIPKPPYKCIVILDGDKRNLAKDVIEKHNAAVTNTSKFKICNTLNEVKKVLKERNLHPIYCLKENCIERYLFHNFDCSKPPANYNKVKNGPKAAEKLEELPNELKELFKLILEC